MDPVEDLRRKAIFEENVKMINAHNEKFKNGETTFTMGINKFSDLDPEEKAKYCGLRPGIKRDTN